MKKLALSVLMLLSSMVGVLSVMSIYAHEDLVEHSHEDEAIVQEELTIEIGEQEILIEDQDLKIKVGKAGIVLDASDVRGLGKVKSGEAEIVDATEITSIRGAIDDFKRISVENKVRSFECQYQLKSAEAQIMKAHALLNQVLLQSQEEETKAYIEQIIAILEGRDLQAR